MKKVVSILILVFIAGCTSVTVKPVDSSHKLSHVCIENNPKVIVKDFVSTVENVFHENGITTEIYTGAIPSKCKYRLTYTALRSWDFTPYLSHAELRLYEDNESIGYAEYHLNLKGGLTLNKWASVKSKMTPVVNKLLAKQSK